MDESGVERLREWAAAYGLDITAPMLDSFRRYTQLLLDWNSRLNLTAVTDQDGILIKHYLDSLLPLAAVPQFIPQGASVIDVGSGAGFPGVPLKILRPDLRLTLLDSLNKRVGFLKELSDALGQENVCIHGRAEQCARLPDHRERYDLALARAVTALPALCEYCIPFLRVGGALIALKGPQVDQEVESAKSAIAVLGGELETVEKRELPGQQGRSLVVVRKRSQTPPKYPRLGAKITKNPL